MTAGGYYYIATPYSLFAGGREAAFRMSCRVTADLMRAGVPCFSPMMDGAKGLIVVKAPGYLESRGVQAEIAVFVAAEKPIHFMQFDPLVIPREVLP